MLLLSIKAGMHASSFQEVEEVGEVRVVSEGYGADT